MKFKVGDKVVIIRNIYGEIGNKEFKKDCIGYDKIIGKIGVIKNLNSDNSSKDIYLVYFDDNDTTIFMREPELLKDTPKNREKALQYKLEKAI